MPSNGSRGTRNGRRAASSQSNGVALETLDHSSHIALNTAAIHALGTHVDDTFNTKIDPVSIFDTMRELVPVQDERCYLDAIYKAAVYLAKRWTVASKKHDYLVMALNKCHHEMNQIYPQLQLRDCLPKHKYMFKDGRGNYETELRTLSLCWFLGTTGPPRFAYLFYSCAELVHQPSHVDQLVGLLWINSYLPWLRDAINDVGGDISQGHSLLAKLREVPEGLPAPLVVATPPLSLSSLEARLRSWENTIDLAHRQSRIDRDLGEWQAARKEIERLRDRILFYQTPTIDK